MSCYCNCESEVKEVCFVVDNNMRVHHFLQFLLILYAPVVSGVTVNFGDATLGPSDSLQFGGVTVTGSGQVATAAGYGLGSTALGPADEVNNEIQYLPTQGAYRSPSSVQWEGVSFSVNGYFNSITILPVFRAYTDAGVLLPDQFNFWILFDNWNGTFSQSQYIDLSSGNPITFLNDVSLGKFSSFSIAVFLDHPDLGTSTLPYSGTDLTEGVNVEEGFTVQSLDYTPTTATPEPTTLALVGLGLGVFLMFRRKKAYSSCFPVACHN
jgi:hypothetical protein